MNDKLKALENKPWNDNLLSVCKLEIQSNYVN